MSLTLIVLHQKHDWSQELITHFLNHSQILCLSLKLLGGTMGTICNVRVLEICKLGIDKVAVKY